MQGRRNDYGSLGRRSGCAVWQWTAIGLIFGLACSATLVLALLTVGVLAIDSSAIPGQPTRTPNVEVRIITATPLPATATFTPSPTTEATPTTAAVAQVIAPSATPTVDPVDLLIDPSPQPTSALQSPPTEPLVGAESVNASPGEVPAQLASLITDTVLIDGGTFQMGTTPAEVQNAVAECVDVWGGNCTVAMGEDSAPAHSVTLDSFFMEITEVTYEQYMAFLNAMGPNSHRNGCAGQPCLATRNETETSNVIFDSANYDVPDVINNHPVANVTWYGAQAYCEAIGRRLPTEAEWERAARGTANNLYPWGNEFDTELAKTSRPVDAPIGAVPVGTYPLGASEFGLLDMAGNVGEWVSDWYLPNYYSQPQASELNPQGPPAGTEKVVRGGSWDTPPFFARSVHRQSLQPNDQALWAGFRCAADRDSAAAAQPVNPGGGTQLTTDVEPQGAAPAGAQTGGTTNQGSAPTLPPPPASNAPLPTLPPGG